jgi:hypothetical protein
VTPYFPGTAVPGCGGAHAGYEVALDAMFDERRRAPGCAREYRPNASGSRLATARGCTGAGPNRKGSRRTVVMGA